jgi:Asp-tRNA(Asn)/Glu-tRNA(Gln) amidotransferase A subunit family amidase
VNSKTSVLSNIDLDLCYLSATEAIARFKARTLSPVELLEALIMRVEKVNPLINAFNMCLFDEAREAAKAAEVEYQKNDSHTRLLEGIPIAIKDGHRFKGHITTAGTKVLANNRDIISELHIERLLEAGAIPIARSTCPEFMCTPYTHSPLWGITHNPWNSSYNPGGSSGGAAAALAAGMVTVADGSDYGGSIRIPASCCGVFGYKPPSGRIPLFSNWAFDIYDHAGLLSRTVADGALMLNVMSGHHPLDPISHRQEVKIPANLRDIRGFKVAVSPNLGYFEVDREVAENFFSAVDVFRELGCSVEVVDLPWTSASLAAWMDHACGAFATWILPLLGLWRYELSDYVVEVARRGEKITMTDLYRGYQVASGMYSSLGPILEKYDILLCPTTALPAVPANFSFVEENLEINGKPVDSYIGWCMTYPFNMLGMLPVASVPSGFASNGIPTGLQIVGRSFDDIPVFQAAAAYEQVRPWLRTIASRPSLPS